jgi:hypothetical protein
VNDLRERIAELTNARVDRIERIQSLWGGYGELVRAHLASGASVIAKSVQPPMNDGSISHARKRRSYDVELTFYRRFARDCDDGCRVAKFYGSRISKSGWIFVFEDLDAAGFRERHSDPTGQDLDACLSWLATFHARFLGVRPDGLWAIGTYWHLDTRQEELAAMRDESLRARAPTLDRMLREARFQTLVHGDAKPDNFCFSPRGVAAVDFQYVGGGCGVKDVAYLLHGTTKRIEERSLSTYFSRLRAALSDDVDQDAMEREWRSLYPAAKEDFERFLAGWRK